MKKTARYVKGSWMPPYDLTPCIRDLLPKSPFDYTLSVRGYLYAIDHYTPLPLDPL